MEQRQSLMSGLCLALFASLCFGFLIAGTAEGQVLSSSGSYAVNFSCSVSSNNGGRACVVECPIKSGRQTKMVGAKAVCNNEVTSTRTSLDSISIGRLYVEEVSLVSVGGGDYNLAGACWFNDTTFPYKGSYPMLDDIPGSYANSVGCWDYDVNGGDCIIRGTIYCQ